MESDWNAVFAAYSDAHPELATEFLRRMSNQLPDDWSEFADKAIATVNAAGETVATRKASLIALNAFAPALPGGAQKRT